MPNKSYRKGYRFEKQVQKEFEKWGYLVIRQGKSKFPDLIAIPPRENEIVRKVTFVECKYNKKPTKEEVKKLIELERKYDVFCLFVIKEKGEKDWILARPEDFL